MCSRCANVSDSAIVPQCRFGNTSCESSGTVAGPIATGAMVPAGAPVRDVGELPTFGVGDFIVVTATATPGHSRCPGYLRGHCGTVLRIYTRAYSPEWRAHSPLKRREFTYAVEFDPTELWSDGDPDQTVVVELFESYLNRIEMP